MISINSFASALFSFEILDVIEIDENSWLSLHSVILTCLAFMSLFVLLEWRKRNQESPQKASALPWKKVPHGRVAGLVSLLGLASMLLWILTTYFAGGWRLEFFAIFIGLSCGLGAVWSGASRSRESAIIVRGIALIFTIIGAAITFLWESLPTSASLTDFQTFLEDNLISLFFLIIFAIIGQFWAHEVVMSSSPATYSWHDFLRYLIPTISYSISGLWKHKRRSLNIIIVIVISVAMVTSLAIWLDRAPVEAIEKALDERDYHLYVQRRGFAQGPLGGDNRILREIRSYLLSPNEELVNEAEIVYNTIALFNTENKTDDYSMEYSVDLDYNISLNQVYATRVLPNQQAQLVSETFMNRIKDQLRIVEGSFEFGENKIIMNKRLRQHINESIGRWYKPGDSFEMALARNDLDPEEDEIRLGSYNRETLANVEIAAIVERVPIRRYTSSTFSEETLGDGVYISKDFIGDDFLLDIETGITSDRSFALVFPRLFVRLDKNAMARISWRNIESEMQGLETRIRSQGMAQLSAAVFFEMNEVYAAISLYRETRWVIVFLLVPIVALSILLVILTIGVLNRSREMELQILRTRGGDLVQVVGSVLLELIILGVIGLRVGISAGVFLASMIPGTKRFLVPNMTETPELRDLVTFSSESWMNTVILFGLALLIGLIIQSFFQIRDLMSFQTSEEPENGMNPIFAYINDHNIDLIVLLLGFPLLFWLVDSDILSRTFSDQEFLALHLTFAIILWLGFAAITARVMTLIISKSENLLRKVFSTSAFVIVTNLKRRQHLISILAFVTTVTFSIGIFASIYNETMWTNTENQMRFVVGSDFKILTDQVPWSMSNNFTSLGNGELISEAMPISMVSGEKADKYVAILGVNATQYARIGYWDDSAFDAEKNRVVYESMIFAEENRLVNVPKYSSSGEERSVRKIMEDLANIPNGMIINDRLASFLQKDVGDSILLSNVVTTTSGSGSEEIVQIVAICHSAPGIGILSNFRERPSLTTTVGTYGAAIVNNHDLAALGIDQANAFLLKSAPNSNPEEIVSAIREFDEVRAIYYFDYFTIEEEGFLALGGVPGILTIDFIGSLAIIAFALGAFLEFILKERQQEYALLRAVGATKRDVSKSIIGEFLGIALISLAIGGFVSLIFSMAFLELSVGNLTIFSILPYSIYIPLPTIAVTVFLVFAFLMMGAVWPSRRASQTRIADVLRNL